MAKFIGKICVFCTIETPNRGFGEKAEAYAKVFDGFFLKIC